MRNPACFAGPGQAVSPRVDHVVERQNDRLTSSSDLIHWSPQRALPVMANEPECQTCWAPELFDEHDRGRFSIVWSSSIRGKFDGGKRAYATTTADFQAFTPSRLFFDPGFTVIDETIVPFDGKYRLIFKDERDTPAGKTLRFAVGDTMEGPWGTPSKPFTRRMVEGPTWLFVGHRSLVYFDCFREGHFGAMTTTDFHDWRDVTGRLVLPGAARNGASRSPAR